MNAKKSASTMRSAFSSPRALSCLILAGAAAMMAVFSYPLFVNEVFLEGDISANYLPLRHFYAECLQKGDSFLWIPHIFSGFYLHAEGQVGMLHPEHMLLYKYLPLTQALDLELLLCYPFMFLGTILFLRRWKLAGHAVLFGALLYTFSGYSMNRYLWILHIEVIAHTPWILWAIDIAMRSRERKKVAAASLLVVLLTLSQFLIGYPQLIYVMGLAEGLYTLFLLRLTPNRWRIFVLLGAKLLALMCAGVQILPTLDLLRHSTRMETSFAFRMSTSLHPMNIFQLINPYLFNHRMYDGFGREVLYSGAVMTALALFVVLRLKHLRVSKLLTLCALVTAVVGLILTLGKYGYLFRLLAMLPVIDKFRGPVRHGAMFHAGWFLLATLGYAELSALVSRRIAIPWKTLLPLALLPATSLFFAVLVVVLRLDPEILPALEPFEFQYAPTANVLLGTAIMVIATGCVVAVARGWRYALPILVVFTVGDLSVYGLRHPVTDTLEGFLETVDVPDASTEYRLAPDYRPVWWLNGPLMKGYTMADGYVSIPPKKHLDYYLDPIGLRLAGTRWVRTRIGGTTELNERFAEGIDWVELPNPMPRVRLVTKALVSTDPAEDARTVDLATTALVDRPVDLEQGTPGEARVTLERPGIIHVETKAPTRQLLVTTESYYDDWRVTVDGDEQAPLPVYGDFLGTVVEAGEHEVQFRFEPLSFTNGKRVTAAGLVLTLVYYLALLRFLPQPAFTATAGDVARNRQKGLSQ